MKIICLTPLGRDKERAYIFGVILGQWLGLDWEHIPSRRAKTSLQIAGSSQKLHLPDTFFTKADGNWLAPVSLPQSPLVIWDSEALKEALPLVIPILPVIFGNTPITFSASKNTITLPIDIFGSAFFMLTRYEEMVLPDRDNHDRFPSSACIARQEGFLNRPIIDEYVEILWAAMNKLWPQLKRKPQTFKTILSHDVDRPGRYAFSSPKHLVKRIGGDVLKQGKLLSPLIGPWIRLNSKTQLHPRDPYNTFDWIMDLSEKHGLQSAFYFLCGRSHITRDADYEIEHPAMRNLLGKIRDRGHEVGLHPSYNTYLSPEKIMGEAERLRKVCREEAITQQEWGGRMHYLRWRQPETLRAWEQAGMAYDSSLSYADHVGFRCGTCHEYSGYDASRSREMNILIRPLIAMEGSVIGSAYMNLGTKEGALKAFITLKNACRTVNGNFTLLWHNSELDTREKRMLYEHVLNS